MKEKSQIEKNAAQKQIELLSSALSGASEADGHWLNAAGKHYPRLYPQGVSASPFNALFMALHSDSKDARQICLPSTLMPRQRYIGKGT